MTYPINFGKFMLHLDSERDIPVLYYHPLYHATLSTTNYSQSSQIVLDHPF